jgi:hypothetical protein
MFTTSADIQRLEEQAITKEISQWSQDERLQLLYAATCRSIEHSQTLGFTGEDFTMVAGLVYFDRTRRLSDVPFPTTTEALSAIFRELDQDPDTTHLLDWLAKNLPRFSRIGLHKPSATATLKGLMMATGIGLEDRNPNILRAVAQLALEEYVARNYNRDKLKDLLHTILEQLNDEQPRV